MTGNTFRKPHIWLTASWPYFALIMVFSTGDRTLASFGLLMLFLPTLIAWLVMIVHALILRRFRYFILLSISGVFAFSIAYLCLRFSDEIHFQVMRPFYLIQINSASKKVIEKDWDWGGTWNSQEDLLYIRNVMPSSLAFDEDDPSYNTTIKKMNAHFFYSILFLGLGCRCGPYPVFTCEDNIYSCQGGAARVIPIKE